MNDFSKTTITKLRKNGFVLIGLQQLENFQRGYILVKDERQIIRTHSQVLDLV